MVKLFKLHKLAGLLAGGLLFLLAITGFLLDHDSWRFLYTVTVKTYPEALLKKEKRLFEGYYAKEKLLVVCGKRGIFKSDNGGKSFKKVLPLQCNALRENGGTLFAATDDGIYVAQANRWRRLALGGSFINALAVEGDTLLAVEDKRRLYLLYTDGTVLQSLTVALNPQSLGRPVTLARLVRDLHYGRGLFDGDASLLLNDYAAFVLAWLALSGYLIWLLIRQKRGRSAKKAIKAHASFYAVLAAIPLIILAVTGIFLDHARALGSFMKSVSIPSALLPPVYESLKTDVWSVDIHGSTYRIGNRYGVFVSRDLQTWQPENEGFAYRMIRRGERLYVSGMGAPNRLLENKHWRPLPGTPHMFKDLVGPDDAPIYFSPRRHDLPLPRFKEITLYTLLLGLHDGSFFASWWIWLNDLAALGLLLLLFSGIRRWLRQKGRLFRFRL